MFTLPILKSLVMFTIQEQRRQTCASESGFHFRSHKESLRSKISLQKTYFNSTLMEISQNHTKSSFHIPDFDAYRKLSHIQFGLDKKIQSKQWKSIEIARKFRLTPFYKITYNYYVHLSSSKQIIGNVYNSKTETMDMRYFPPF